MAIFSAKKDTKKEGATSKKAVVVAKERGARPVAHGVLLRPRITEKASLNAESNVYTFEVAVHATEREVRNAITDMYKVTPVKVNMATIPTKNVFVRGKAGVKGGGKKAYVYVKKGDKIEFI